MPLAPSRNGQATAGSSATLIVQARDTRRGVLIRNMHATESVWIGSTGLTSANGYLLKAGEPISLDGNRSVYALRYASTDVPLCWIETYN